MMNKPRKPWLAGLLTFFAIGLGHVYAGEGKKGIILFFLGQGIFFMAFLLLLLGGYPLTIVIITVISSLIYFVFCLIDAIRISRKNNSTYKLKRYNTWYVYLIYIVMASLIIQPAVRSVIRKDIIQAYTIASGSMMPTLLPGDHIIVNKYFYKTSKPNYGDLIVFEHPKDSTKYYIKRLIGMEGDQVEIKDKEVLVNGVKQNENYVTQSASGRDNYGPVTVPKNKLFFLGDNRDHSFDSRYYGFVSLDKIKGKMIAIYWSWDKKNGKVRWNRIGNSIQ